MFYVSKGTNLFINYQKYGNYLGFITEEIKNLFFFLCVMLFTLQLF